MGGRFFSYAAGSLFAEVLMQRYIGSEMIVALELSSFDRPIGELEVSSPGLHVITSTWELST